MNNTLSPDSQKALRVLLKQPVLSGGELCGLADLTPAQLVAAAKELLDADMISADGTSVSDSQIMKTYFNLKPSARSFAQYAVG